MGLAARIDGEGLHRTLPGDVPGVDGSGEGRRDDRRREGTH